MPPKTPKVNINSIYDKGWDGGFTAGYAYAKKEILDYLRSQIKEESGTNVANVITNLLICLENNYYR